MGRNYCIFAAQYLPHLGGVERYTYNLSKKLMEKGNHVIIVTSNVSHLANYEVMDGIPVYRIPCINLLDGRYPVVKPNGEFFHIHRQLLQKKMDIVLVNTRFYPHSLYGVILAKWKKAKCAVIEHGTSHLKVHNQMWDRIGSVYEHILTRVVRLFCKNYYGVSEACNDWLKHFGIQAKSTLYNAVDLEQIQTLLQKQGQDFRKKYGISQDAIVIAFTGRLLKEKGLPSLIKAMKKINRDRKDIYLLIAGDGDMEQQIDQSKSETIIPLGRLAFEEVIDLLKQSDIFCLPSVSEGFSTSILEAAICHCYIITTERGGSKELVLNADYGTIIDKNDMDTVYHALLDAIEHPAHREKAAEKSYDRVKNNFTWDIVSEKVHHLLE